ncbi:hypothetical protein DSL92_01260 [Billgrantia gudaonensis]|uniref:Transposase n=1 Tax=Billgrantia gudaonensis TaxID=376427 RepID=A0A432JKG3_9GAMM|nr:hypothetical protein DSL92_01260 [Halomonas gudaonensis]
MADARHRGALRGTASRSEPYATRRDRLNRLAEMTHRHRGEIVQAIRQDFGYRRSRNAAEIATLHQR